MKTPIKLKHIKEAGGKLALPRTKANPKTLLVPSFPYEMFEAHYKSMRSAHLIQDALFFQKKWGPEVIFQQLYEDSDDVGFAIRFDFTGNIGAYKLVRTRYNKQGGIDSWEYAPTTHSIQTVPECKGTRVILFNGAI